MSDIKADLSYSIIFDTPKEGLIEVKDFSEGIKECLSALEEFNRAISSSVDSSIEICSYIQELKSGSIDFTLVDKLAEGCAIGVGSTIGVQGVYRFQQLLIAAKKIFVTINNERLENKEKKKKICDNIKKAIQDSDINNVLKGYSLNEKSLERAMSKFANGVKKTKDNVYFKDNKESKKIHINSSLSELFTENDENVALRTETVSIRIIKPDLEGKSKWNCYWNKKIKCTVSDEDFIAKVKGGFRIGNKMRFTVDMQIADSFNANGNVIEGKEKYNIIKVLKIHDQGREGQNLELFNNKNKA